MENQENQVEQQIKIHQQQTNLKIKKIFWNLLIILVVGCLAIAAIEGIGIRQKIAVYNPEEPWNVLYYNIQVLNLTKLSAINDQYNHLLDIKQLNNFNNKSLLLAHDTYSLFTAGISIIFISTLIPLFSFFNQKAITDKNLIIGGRTFSGLGWLLILIGAIVFVTKTLTNVNDLVNDPNYPGIIYQSFSEIFDVGAIAGLFILIGLSGVPLLLNISLKSWSLVQEKYSQQDNQQFVS